MEMFKYQGAGNDFILIDNRMGKVCLSPDQIEKLCNRHYGIGGDGLMLLETAEEPYGFKMVYYNSDGSGGMMCGNGGRCIAAFAHRLGIENLNFIAADGPHLAEIVSSKDNVDTVRLQMKDVDDISLYHIYATIIDENTFDQRKSQIVASFLDTGTRHLVVPVDNLSQYPVVNMGRSLRNLEIFAPIGTNVNFTEYKDDVLHVRTFEKGVEDETCACGTGIVASAIAFWHKSHDGSDVEQTKVTIPIQALHDKLSVDFVSTADGAADVWLSGPATYVAKIETPD